MGRTILCNECHSTFDEDILKKKNSENKCLVCGALLGGNSSSHMESPSFGDGIELSENDSFDEEKIDFWWYSIREPGTDGTSKGRVYTTCSKCGCLSFAPYPVMKSGEYLLVDARYVDQCSKCGNTMKNHILSKRPADWVDPRQCEMWAKDYSNIPKCPVCNSTKIHKISMTNKAASALAFGVFAAGHVSKTYKCDICGSKF